MVGLSVATAKASPVNRAQRDRRVDIEIPAHNISDPNGWVTQGRARGEFGVRTHCSILSRSPRFVTWDLQGKYNQSCQQYRSDNSISPKPATKRFLIFRFELSIFVDELSEH
jgi:hypothetical protein